MTTSGRSTRAALSAAALCTAFFAAGCGRGVEYGSFAHTPADGWRRGDSVELALGPVERGGLYSLGLSVRADASYPFGEMAVVVATNTPSGGVRTTDTILLRMADSRGKTGRGVAYLQHDRRVADVVLAPGDSLQVSVCHGMARSPLPGIRDIGAVLRLEKETGPGK